MKYVIHVAAIAAFAVASNSPVTAQPTFDYSAIDDLFAEYASQDSPGCAVGVIAKNELKFAKGYGMANLDWDMPITPTTRFYTGSVGKQFTAAAIAHAARAGHLSLDDTIQTWVPEIPEYDVPITVRQLIHHTSGLRDNLRLRFLAGSDLRDMFSDEETIAMLARQKSGSFPAGERYSYSNSGYFLLSVIIKRATGQSLRDYADKHFFQPLGMESTRFHDEPSEIMAERAVGYRIGPKGPQMDHLWNMQQVGAGGVYTTLVDLVAWDRNFYTEEVGGPGFTDLLLEVGTLSDGSSTKYAFGLGVGSYRGKRVVRHGGSLAAFRTGMVRFPDQQTSIFVLCNTVTDAMGLAHEVADIFLEDELEARDMPQNEGRTAIQQEQRQPGANLSDEQVRAFAGKWWVSEMNLGFELLVEEERLFLVQNRRAPATLISDHAIEIEAVNAHLLFSDLIDGRFGSIQIEQNGQEFSASRASAWADVAPFIGRYYSDELDVTYQIQAENGGMRISNNATVDAVIFPKEDELQYQVPFGTIRFDQANGSISGFTLDNGRAEGLHFTKR